MSPSRAKVKLRKGGREEGGRIGRKQGGREGGRENTPASLTCASHWPSHLEPEGQEASNIPWMEKGQEGWRWLSGGLNGG